MKAELASSQPIQELHDNMLNPAYFTRFQSYLEKECGCSCTAMDNHTVAVHFPDGTLEEEYAGQSTPWRRETTIRLANGVKLIKRVYPPMVEGEKTLVALLLPQGVFAKRGMVEEHYRDVYRRRERNT
ncbi:MAG: hypothetical protein JOZ18_12210 [Chloroflexi bacterium]|nr:hypothetical protein [Chloroflexota bacterium]